MAVDTGMGRGSLTPTPGPAPIPPCPQLRSELSLSAQVTCQSAQPSPALRHEEEDGREQRMGKGLRG